LPSKLHTVRARHVDRCGCCCRASCYCHS
jgi:hypothetical protein